VLNIFLENITRDAVTYTEHARRKTTVTAMDVLHAGHTCPNSLHMHFSSLDSWRLPAHPPA
jgi:histone H3/H4